MTNERPSDATTPASEDQIKDLAPAEISEEQVRGGDSTTPTESVSLNFGTIKWTYTQQDKAN